MLISDVVSPNECLSLLHLAESANDSRWEAAQINAGMGKQILATDYRNSGRIIWDTSTIADLLLARILPFLPADITTLDNALQITGWGPVRRKEIYRLTRLNERLRFLKYGPGQYFREHCDGSYETPDGKEISYLTMHLYLNNSEEAIKDTSATPPISDTEKSTDGIKETSRGGATRFISDGTRARGSQERFLDVNPKAGSVLIFQHRNMWHEGREVEKGIKYTVRTDVMYTKIDGD